MATDGTGRTLRSVVVGALVVAAPPREKLAKLVSSSAGDTIGLRCGGYHVLIGEPSSTFGSIDAVARAAVHTRRAEQQRVSWGKGDMSAPSQVGFSFHRTREGGGGVNGKWMVTDSRVGQA